MQPYYVTNSAIEHGFELMGQNRTLGPLCLQDWCVKRITPKIGVYLSLDISFAILGNNPLIISNRKLTPAESVKVTHKIPAS